MKVLQLRQPNHERAWRRIFAALMVLGVAAVPFAVVAQALTASTLQAPAVAPAVPVPAVDGAATGSILVHSFASHQWGMGIAALVMFAIWVLGKMRVLLWINPKYVPLVAVVLTVASAVCTAALAHVPILDALWAGGEAGLAAVGTWEAAGQHILTFGAKAA